jgi:hypothetical protein
VAAIGLVRGQRSRVRPIPLPLTAMIAAFTVLTTLAASSGHTAH